MYSYDIYVPFFNSSSRKIELNSAERIVGVQGYADYSHHWRLMLCVQSTASQWWERVCATLAILQHLSFTGSHTPPDFKSM